VEFADLFGGQGTLAAELLDDERDFSEVLDGLHIHVSLHEVAAVGDDAVVGHEDGIVAWNEGLEGFGELGGAGGCVMGEGNFAEREQDFTDESLIEGESAGSKSGGSGRMGVDNGVDVWTHAVDGHVHADFAGDIAEAGDSSTVHIDHEKVFGGHHALADASRGDEDGNFAETHGYVAVGGGNEAVFVQHLAEA